MKKTEVAIGKVYIVKVSGVLAKVRLDSESPYGGWNGTNLGTGRGVRIRSAAKLRRETSPTVLSRKPMKLIDSATRRELQVGEEVAAGDDRYILRSWREPHHPGSTGRVFLSFCSTPDSVEQMAFFPSVIGAEFIRG